MLFTTDKQTLDDLNIFGIHGRESIYSIYNQTVTREGAAILSEMFNYPLSDVQAINRRSGIIQYFAAQNIQFPFPATQFDAIEPYLGNTDERTKLSAQDHSLGRKLTNLIAVDIDTAAIHKGVITLAGLIKSLYEFVITLQLEDGHPYRSDKDAILQILADSAFAAIVALPADHKLTEENKAVYDLVFRFSDRDAIRKLLRYIGYIDVYSSVAKTALTHRFIFPKALPKEQHVLLLEGVFHPQVKNAIANSFGLTANNNVTFLTGANMAGKSTFMKSLGVAMYLAHMGFPVAAAKMEFSVMDGIFTTINLPDNLGMGTSHFYAEVLRVKKVAKELKMGKNLFVIIDELFRGTNVKDAYEATISITSAFAAKRNSMFVISTHIIEAGDVLKERCENIDFKYLPTRMDGNKPVYTHKLETGITSDRHGMVIINNEGILQILKDGIERINKTAKA